MKIFVYQATDAASGEKINGQAMAKSEDLARRRLERFGGMKIRKLYYDPVASLSWSLNPNFPRREVGRLFVLLGRYLSLDKVTIAEGFERAKDFSSHPLLNFACENTVFLLGTGKTVSEAMVQSGFSKVDCAVMSALLKAREGRGGSGVAQAFLTRGESLEFEAAAETRVGKKMMTLMGFFIFLILGWYAILFVFGPETAKTINDLVAQKKQNMALRAYVGIVGLLGERQLMFSIAYFSAAGLGVYYLTGDRRHRLTALLFPKYEKFKYFLEQYRTWQLWRMLSASNVSNTVIFDLSVRMVGHPSVANQNRMIASQLRRGRSLVDSVRKITRPYKFKKQMMAVLGLGNEAMSEHLDLIKNDIQALEEQALFRLDLTIKILVAISLILMLSVVLLPPLMIAASV